MTNPWLDRPTFVTGATGLLGSWLVRRLVDSGAEVVCLIRDWVPQSELVRTDLIDKVRVVRGEIVDQDLLDRAIGEYEIDTVFHLAAQTIVRTANRDPTSTLDANIRGTWTVLEACRRISTVRQVVCASSDKAYGAHETLPYDESTALIGRHPYDVSKSCSDLIATAYATTYDLPVAITRCGNFFGGGDLNWNRIVPGTIRSVLRGEAPVIRSDGLSSRDYLYVEDGAESYLALAEALMERPELRGEAFNFGHNTPLTVIDLVEKILQVTGRSDLQSEILCEAPNEIPHQYLDSAKAREVLGWSPRFTLEEGLERTVDWYRKFLDASH